jgi:hypothetical protein
MNITFIIGNGFDISYGLKSSYKSFYEWYLKQPRSSEIISQFKENIKRNKADTWADFEKGLGEYSRQFTIDNIDDFYECYQDAHYKLMEYLENQEQNITVSDDEVNIFSNSLLDFYSELIPVEQEMFQNMTTNISADINYRLVSLNYTYLVDEFLENFKSPLKTWNAGGYNRRASVEELVHAHGYSDKWPILAVDNISQLNENLLEDDNFQNIMVKSNAVSTAGEHWTDRAESIIDHSDIICLYGVSIGETDTRWWKRVCKWLENPNKKLVVFWYDENMTSDNISLLTKMRNEDRVKRKILSYANENARSEISKKISVIINTKYVFKFRGN